MEENSQTSTITFGAETKRKREETEIESNFRCLRPSNFRCIRLRNCWCLRLRCLRCRQLREMPVNIDVGYFFLQLGLARYKRRPYDQFQGWDDLRLWDKILRVLCVNLIHQPTIDQLVQVFNDYRREYERDPILSCMKDLDLRAKILTVFELKSDDIGVPYIPANLISANLGRQKKIESQCKEIDNPQRKFDPYSLYQSSSSDDCCMVGYAIDPPSVALNKIMKERKKLANTYCQDALTIGVNPSEMGQLLSKYPPDSSEYLVAKSMPNDEMRRKTFQSIHETFLKESSQSSKESSSSVPRKRNKHIS